jgi:hypothetical protein
MRASLPVFVLLLFTPGCPARIVGIPNVADLTEKAHLIVVGEVIRVDTVGNGRLPYNGTEFPVLNKRTEFRVDATLKDAATSSTIRVVYSENETFESGPLTNALTAGTYCMLFLIERDEGYGFVEPAQSTMPMSRDLAALPSHHAPTRTPACRNTWRRCALRISNLVRCASERIVLPTTNRFGWRPWDLTLIRRLAIRVQPSR